MGKNWLKTRGILKEPKGSQRKCSTGSCLQFLPERVSYQWDPFKLKLHNLAICEMFIFKPIFTIYYCMLFLLILNFYTNCKQWNSIHFLVISQLNCGSGGNSRMCHVTSHSQGNTLLEGKRLFPAAHQYRKQVIHFSHKSHLFVIVLTWFVVVYGGNQLQWIKVS